jgi:RNA polymerase sigma factor (TIGR02999 family)
MSNSEHHPDRDLSDSPAVRVVALLEASQEGQTAATGQLVALLHAELRAIAGSLLRREPSQQTLQPTALVHEAFLKLVGGGRNAPSWSSRAHFFGAAARAMRQILVDRARAPRTTRRADLAVESIVFSLGENEADSDDRVLRLDTAMESLRRIDERRHEIVMLRFFAGLTIEQTAEVLGVSTSTIKGESAFARAWLLREIDRPDLAGQGAGGRA